jgi:hypothetical protein
VGGKRNELGRGTGARGARCATHAVIIALRGAKHPDFRAGTSAGLITTRFTWTPKISRPDMVTFGERVSVLKVAIGRKLKLCRTERRIGNMADTVSLIQQKGHSYALVG